jgi:hypothetical protein
MLQLGPRVQDRLVVLAGVDTALIGVMQQADVETASFQRHPQRFDRHVAIIDGAQGPPCRSTERSMLR